MRRILIRGGISPLDNVNSEEMLLRDFSGSNIGNYLYQYSIFRALSVENTELYVDNYASNIKNADAINNKYDQYILALADAFREDFIPQLRAYTELIKKLNIPVIVVGVGLRAAYDTKLEENFIFDDIVKDFIAAVLEKSTIVGVRGQITADYLSKLGFREGIDHQVIGCPSMYAYGGKLKIADFVLEKQSKITLNLSEKSPDNCVDFINNLTKKFENYTFIPQIYNEFLLSYGGASISSSYVNYPSTLKHKIYQDDKVKFFHNLQPWLKFMGEIDFSIGTRLHGNIAATIAGKPNVLITTDARTKELAEYHNLPVIPYFNIKDNDDLDKLLENIDLYSAEKKQSENFKNYLLFLEKNNVKNIYEIDQKANNPNFDDLFFNGEYEDAIQVISHCTPKVIVERLTIFNDRISQRNKRLNHIYINMIKTDYENHIRQLEKEVEFLKGRP
ncbi:polysaccharide pyruvyl transferase family protein [Brochothrix thermosphacta]|uniref:polysaccharide pyruvyl transferase family protein n=1 Tax=Brochothrix thermosphacta TaxID=2756 RepID=UPI0027134F53|nr:polysaccharide pyruvyl transferase family protein [Brochothrix thermosphacta]MDO7864913.1 polysaccharide pyruvyl transferase family protein [Brochothrix thermosphacta]